MDTATSKALGVDTTTDKSPCMDTVMARRGYSDALFLLLPILHQKLRNVENLHGKIRAFVLVSRNTQEGDLIYDNQQNVDDINQKQP